MNLNYSLSFLQNFIPKCPNGKFQKSKIKKGKTKTTVTTSCGKDKVGSCDVHKNYNLKLPKSPQLSVPKPPPSLLKKLGKADDVEDEGEEDEDMEDFDELLTGVGPSLPAGPTLPTAPPLLEARFLLPKKTQKLIKPKFSTGLIKPKISTGPKLTGIRPKTLKEFKPKMKKLEETCFYMDEQFLCLEGPVSTEDGVVTCGDGTTVGICDNI